MISLTEATQIIKHHLPTPQVELLALKDSSGYYLAEELTAPEPLPGFNNSAMDGYAVALPELMKDQHELSLQIVGESRAGVPYRQPLEPGTAVRISTGAFVPDRSDLVVKVEDTSEIDGKVKIKRVPEIGSNIRYRGEEVKAGDPIAQPHQLISPAMIAWLASFGVTEVPVFRKPSVALLTTGEELVEYTDQPGPGQIRNSNQVFGTHFLRLFGIDPVISERIGDSLGETMEGLERAREAADLILVSGGVSVGEHDHVKAAAEKIGFSRQFWKVSQKPGKPLYFATSNETLLFGLPGNPVSAMVNTVYHILPILRALRGARPVYPEGIPVRLADELAIKKSRRTRFLMVRLVGETSQGVCHVKPVSHQASHMISGVVESDGIIVVPAEATGYPSGESLTMFRFPWRERL